ncbi:MAG: phosphoglucosamine mutase, partial [Deltaproteobacteria bacterium]|nr:phosphoglucosamine mutase [Deltaproteobacteria bacterium]
MEKLFGTDGVRGTANRHPMTAEMAMSLGQALAHVFNLTGGQRHRVIIGKDTRVSGYMFESALTAGICSMGVDVLQVGPVPTPAMAFLTADMRCDAGIMITASHNPYCDNGIKFFSKDGFKLPDDIEQRIEELIHHNRLQVCESPEHIGRAKRIDDVRGRYVVFAKQTFPSELTLDGLRVVLDCGNGAGYKVAPTALQELGAEVFALGVDPDGYN